MHHQIGNVAVDENIPRQQTHQLVGGNPAVGATDPEVFRGLLGGEGSEEIRVFGLDPFRPLAVVGKQVVQQFHYLLSLLWLWRQHNIDKGNQGKADQILAKQKQGHQALFLWGRHQASMASFSFLSAFFSS